jgi:hypothetical protein
VAVPGVGRHPNVCLKLLKALYGIKQAPRAWNQFIDKWLTEGYGLKALASDPCVYVRIYSDRSLIIIVLYVDDLTIVSSSLTEMAKFKKAISNAFKMKDLGPISWVLGMQVIRDRTQRTLEIRQERYIDEMVRRFDLANAKPRDTPCDGRILSELEENTAGGDNAPGSTTLGPTDKTLYQAIIGSLQYAAGVSRPDISVSLKMLSRFLVEPNEAHLRAARRVLMYLKGTRSLGIKFSADSWIYSESDVLQGYCDADYAGCVDTRKSTSGYVFVLNGGPISWKAKLQDIVTLSSAESEYVALTSACQEAIYLRELLQGLGCVQRAATDIFEDNQASIALAQNSVFHNRTKHIAVRYHFNRQAVEAGLVRILFLSTTQQVADLLTKPLVGEAFRALRNHLHGLI